MFCHLPISSFGFSFHFHAPFITTSSRETIDYHHSHNQFLSLSLLPSLLLGLVGFLKGLCQSLQKQKTEEKKREKEGEALKWGEVEEVWGSGMNFLPIGGVGGEVFGGVWKVVKNALALPFACSFVCASSSSSLPTSSLISDWVLTAGGSFAPPSHTLFCDPSSSLSLYHLTTTTSSSSLSFLHPHTYLQEKVAETMGIRKITFADLIRFYNTSVTELVQGVTPSETPSQSSVFVDQKIRDNVGIIREWLCFLHRELVKRGGGGGGRESGFGGGMFSSVLSSVLLPVQSSDQESSSSKPRVFLHSMREGVCYLEGGVGEGEGEEGMVVDCLSRPLLILSSLFEKKKKEKKLDKEKKEEEVEDEEEEERREEARMLVRRCGVKVLDVHGLVEQDILLPLSSWSPSSSSSSSSSSSLHSLPTSSQNAQKLIYLTQLAAVHYKKCKKCQKEDSLFHKLFDKKLFVCVEGQEEEKENAGEEGRDTQMTGGSEETSTISNNNNEPICVSVCDGRVIFSPTFSPPPTTPKPPPTTPLPTPPSLPPPPPQALQAFLPYSLSPLYLQPSSPPLETMIFFFENIGVRKGLPLVRRGEEGEKGEWDCPPVRKLVCSLGLKLFSPSDAFRFLIYFITLFCSFI